MEIKITKTLQQPMFEMKEEHFHTNCDEIFYLCSGSRRFFVGCTIYTLNAGDLMYIPSGCLHRTAYNDKNAAERIVMTFSDDVSPYLKDFHKERMFHLKDCPEVEKILESIIHEENSMSEYSEQMQRHLINILVIILLRKSAAVTENVRDEMSDDEQIQRTAEYISVHFHEKFTLDRAAEYAGFSRTYFSQKFKAVTGFGFNDYLTAVRLRHAVDLLLNTDMSITETAYSCGFNDSNYFGGVFRRHFGVPPREYRRRYKE